MPELSSQMERELAELEAALAAVVRDVRPEPAPEFVRRLDRNVELGSWHEPRPALGTAAAALLVALVIALPKGGDEEEMAAGGAVATQSSRGESGGGGASAPTADSEGAPAGPETLPPRSPPGP